MLVCSCFRGLPGYLSSTLNPESCIVTSTLNRKLVSCLEVRLLAGCLMQMRGCEKLSASEFPTMPSLGWVESHGAQAFWHGVKGFSGEKISCIPDMIKIMLLAISGAEVGVW